MEGTRTQKQVVGALGEDIAARFLKGRGFEVIGRNYRKKFGELDVIVKKSGVVHFVEVKTVSRENLNTNKSAESGDDFRPEDNVHPWKLKRLTRAIQAYLIEYRLGEEAAWQFDVVTVSLDVKNKLARVKFLEDIIL